MILGRSWRLQLVCRSSRQQAKTRFLDAATEREVSLCERIGCRGETKMETVDWLQPKSERSSWNQKIGKN